MSGAGQPTVQDLNHVRRKLEIATWTARLTDDLEWVIEAVHPLAAIQDRRCSCAWCGS